MIKMYDHVEIITTGVRGILVDIFKPNGKGKMYTIEDDEITYDELGRSIYKLHDCKLEELRKI